MSTYRFLDPVKDALKVGVFSVAYNALLLKELGDLIPALLGEDEDEDGTHHLQQEEDPQQVGELRQGKIVITCFLKGKNSRERSFSS